MRLLIVDAILALMIFKVCSSDNIEGTDDGILMLPNERTSLDDCHIRFPKLNPKLSLIPPVFAHPARSKEFAHIGAIGWTQPDGRVLWQCGGTLIWYNFVLTAAHCVVDARNQPPDVVRFGDLDLSTSNDDEYAQQLRIVEIYRHPDYTFAAHYHDIALLKLEKTVTLHDTVSPVCLWQDDEVRFRKLEATGFGKTGFAEEQIPILLKVSLKPMNNQECDKVYSNGTNQKLPERLANEHICAFDERVDNCSGDSEGSLQVQLLHNGRMSPFIVGVTSFGVPCGTGSPGVYTRVAPFYDWIIDTMNRAGADVDANNMNATLCALRFAKYREYEDSMIMERTNDYVSVNTGGRHIFTARELPSFVVKLEWISDGHANCFGVLIDEDTILTVAHCATFNGTPVHFISYLGGIETDVNNIHVHPEFKQGNAHNDIAIVRLKYPIDISLIQPTCIWHGRNVPDIVDVYGVGRHDINEFFWMGKDSQLDSTETILRSIASFKNTTECVISEQFKSRLPHGLANEHICTGNDVFLVPKSCDLLIGGPLAGKVFRDTATYPMTYGLTQFGRDCGFGEHSVATGFANHLDWMKSVLLPNYQTTTNVVQLIDSDRHEGDPCTDSAGRKGQCVSTFSCSSGWRKLVSAGGFEFCSSSSVVCCPFEQMKNGTIKKSLVNCPKLVQDLNVTNPAGSMAFIGWITPPSKLEFRCLGSIITSRTILTTASCMGSNKPDIVELAPNSTEPPYQVEATLTHLAYNSADHSNDIALVRVLGQFSWSSQLYPSCLWLNTTHSPLVVKAVTTSNGEIYFRFGITMYNTDCQRFHRNELHGSQICARVPESHFVCNSITDQLRYDKIQGGRLATSYVVGLGTRLEGCGDLHYMLYTRISSFVDWIGENVLL